MDTTNLEKEAVKREQKIVDLLAGLERDLKRIRVDIQAVSHPELEPGIDEKLRPDVRLGALDEIAQGNLAHELNRIAALAGKQEICLAFIERAKNR